MPAYVVFVCREIVDQGELNTYWQRVNETLVGHKARVLMDRGRFLILEGQGPVQGVTVYEFPTKDAARNWHDSEAYREVWQHRKQGAKYLVILTEGGVPPPEQRMPHTRAAGSVAPPARRHILAGAQLAPWREMAVTTRSTSVKNLRRLMSAPL